MAILNFSSIFKNSLAHPHVASNVMLKFQKKLISSFRIFHPQENVTSDAGQNPGAPKIPLPLRAGDKKGNSYSLLQNKTNVCVYNNR